VSTAEEVNKVVDKLAEKTGEAVDKLADTAGSALEAVTPLAEQVVREFQIMHAVGAMACGIIGMVLACAGLYTARLCRRGRDNVLEKWKSDLSWAVQTSINGWRVGQVLSFIGATLGLLVAWVLGVYHAMLAASPTYHCLKELTK
jgi:hypothetical protein